LVSCGHQFHECWLDNGRKKAEMEDMWLRGSHWAKLGEGSL